MCKETTKPIACRGRFAGQSRAGQSECECGCEFQGLVPEDLSDVTSMYYHVQFDFMVFLFSSNRGR